MNHDNLDFNRIDFVLLAFLRKNPRGVTAATVTLKLGLPMRSVVVSFRKLRKFQIVRGSGHVLHLTRLGRLWIHENQEKFAFSGEKNWRDVPAEFQQPQLPAFKPYAPLRNKVSKKIMQVVG